MNFRNYLNIPMIPYPSGNLHIGHVRNYVISDIFNKFLISYKYNTYKYIGWDCFGTPAENISILKSVLPIKWIKNNIFYIKKQLKFMGFFYKWKKKYITCNKKYYKLTQWIFLKLLKNKLVYLKKSLINWDPIEKTILSNEQVLNGKGWRSNHKIILIKKKAYFINITNYKKELLNEIKNLNWPNKIKQMQINWIGKIKKKKIFFFF